MSYITRTGNRAATPELRQGDNGAYTYARVIVTDRVRGDGGTWGDGPAFTYRVSVSGSQAENLVAAAEEAGNIRVVFSGRYTVTETTSDDGKHYVNHNVYADEVGVSLRGQHVTVTVDGE